MSTTEPRTYGKPCGTNLVKNLHIPIVYKMLIKNCKRTMMILCTLTELQECKVHDKCLCLVMSQHF